MAENDAADAGETTETTDAAAANAALAGEGKGGDAASPADGAESGRKVAPDWPDDWRTKLAGDDEKMARRLGRFGSPADLWKSYRAMEQKVSSGELKAPLPENATDEQVAEYRKANGIPEKPEGYLEKLPDGLVVGEEDKPVLASFIEKMHGRNVQPEIVQEAVAWYYGEQEKNFAATADLDKKDQQTGEDELRAEWGNEYRGNINSYLSFLDTAPEGLKDQILGGRLADGTKIGNSPAFVRWMDSLRREINPASTVVPGTGMNQMESIADEIAKIEKVMREDRAAYDKDERMQARFTKLLDAQEKLKKRAA